MTSIGLGVFSDTSGRIYPCGLQSHEIWKLESIVSSNVVKQIREQRLMSKAELARKARLSALTVDRIEKGQSCRLETKRKIILALGYSLSEKHKVFPED